MAGIGIGIVRVWCIYCYEACSKRSNAAIERLRKFENKVLQPQSMLPVVKIPCQKTLAVGNSAYFNPFNVATSYVCVLWSEQQNMTLQKVQQILRSVKFHV